MITYRITKSRVDLVTTSDSKAKVEVHQILNFTGDRPADKKQAFLFKASGEMDEKGVSYPVEWEFECESSEIKILDESFYEIDQYVKGSTAARSESLLPREAFSDVNEWLRLGWLDENGSFYGYLEFKKDSEVLRSTVENLLPLEAFVRSMTLAI